MSLYRPRKRRADINIVPLIDVMTALIFFFLLIMRFDDVRALAITPPKAESAGSPTQRPPLVAALNKSGQLYINGQPLDRDAFVQRLSDEASKLPENYILVVADEQSQLKDVFFIVDQAKKFGLAPSIALRPAQ
ncbi:MAG: biopolymer transporter ExbD [Puniceicoccales bacterium]|jgi:biopolymer transport protein ExbD|nr:biopolymer transporter ExbD [Puniceicoccales bacterium]